VTQRPKSQWAAWSAIGFTFPTSGHPGLSKKRAHGVVDEQLAVADVAGEHDVARVAGLRPDLEHRDARLHGAGCEAGAQAVTGEVARVDTGSGDALLDDERYGLAR